jgi:hypothetical protein
VARAVEIVDQVRPDQPWELQEEAQLLLDIGQPESSRTAPGAGETSVDIGHWAALLEQLLAQSELSLTAPGAAEVLEQLVAQLLAHPEVSLTAPGEAVLQQPSVPQQESPETPPMTAPSEVWLWPLQPAKRLSSAAAARVVRVRVIRDLLGILTEAFRMRPN